MVLCLDMPGVDKDGVDIHGENNALRITGRRKEDEVKGTFLMRERRPGTLYQVCTVDATIDQSKMEASMDAGVPTVTLYRRKTERPRRIEIKTK